MLRTTGESTPTAAFAGPSARRRRGFRVALIAVSAGWAVVIALIVIGLAIPPAGPHPALAGPPAHTPAARQTAPSPKPSATSTAPVHRTTQVTRVAPVPVPVAPVKAETSREFASTPVACQPGSKCRTFGCKNAAGQRTATFASVQAAFDGHGTAPADNPASGSFDCGGFSYQSNQLAANGFGPGVGVAVAGKILTLPAVAPGAPDQVIARGQVIHFNNARSRTSELGFFGAGTFGTQHGTVTITYADGSTQKATLQFADWYSDVATPGSVIAASGLWNVPPAQTASFQPVSVYYDQIAVSSSKPIESVTLPKNPNLHLFDIGIPEPASYRTASSAYDDRGLATPANSGDANFDGAGHSYNSDALAAKGLRPGAQVTVHGVRFSWPQFSPDRLDNVRAQGQTIGLDAAGRALSFLGAATLGTQRGTVIIRYADGSSQSAVLSFADWRAGSAVGGGTVVATVPWNQLPGGGQHQVSVYSATVPLRSSKTVVSVTLPVNIDLHVFSVAVGK